MPHRDAGSLARHVFEIANRDPMKLGPLLHPDVDVEFAHAPGRIVHGRDDVMAVVEDEIVVMAVHEAMPRSFHPIDDDRIVIEGRLRWSSRGGGFRDSHAVWALAFDHGLLRTARRAGSLEEAIRKLGGA